jgi:hypothetical protein
VTVIDRFLWRPLIGGLHFLALGALIGVPLVALVYIIFLLDPKSYTLKGTEAAEEIESQVLEPKGITDATVNCPAETDLRNPFPSVPITRTETIECSVSRYPRRSSPGSRARSPSATAVATRGPQRGTVTARAGLVPLYGAASVPGAYDFKANVGDIQVELIEENAQEENSGLSQVVCPSSSKPKKRATFFCTAGIRGGFAVVIVDQTSEDSQVEVRVAGLKLRSRRLATDAALRTSSQRSGRLPGP